MKSEAVIIDSVGVRNIRISEPSAIPFIIFGIGKGVKSLVALMGPNIAAVLPNILSKIKYRIMRSINMM